MRREAIADDYLAGIIDGEGCISISRSGKCKNAYVLSLQITNTCEELIDNIQYCYGGKINSGIVKNYNKTKRLND